ncbi:MAG: pentapeptide repeat-containing protein [Actinobacteria bacterium]|nr:pentapeptide repeat-containing protein [Actinomycetota bacterium]
MNSHRKETIIMKRLSLINGAWRSIRLAIVFTLTSAVVSTFAIAASAGALTSATPCKTIGATRVINGTPHECVRVGNKRQWQVRAGATTTTTTTTSTTTTVPRADQIRPGSDLTRQNLRGINLAGRDLSTARAPYADFTNANLSGAFLMSFNLASATLKGANLSGATGGWLYFNGANLEGANLSKANLRYSNFDAHVDNDTIRVNLRNANLTEAILAGSTFENADLTGASARNADLSSTNMQKAILRNADLTSASFRRADLHDADFTGATLGSNWRSQFEGAQFGKTIWVDGTEWSSMPTRP